MIIQTVIQLYLNRATYLLFSDIPTSPMPNVHRHSVIQTFQVFGLLWHFFFFLLLALAAVLSGKRGRPPLSPCRCWVCGPDVEFHDQYDLDNHMCLHNRDWVFECPYCKKFPDPRRPNGHLKCNARILQNHIGTHTITADQDGGCFDSATMDKTQKNSMTWLKNNKRDVYDACKAGIALPADVSYDVVVF